MEFKSFTIGYFSSIGAMLVCFIFMDFPAPSCNEYQEQAAITLADAEFGLPIKPVDSLDWYSTAFGKARDHFGCVLSRHVRADQERVFYTKGNL